MNVAAVRRGLPLGRTLLLASLPVAAGVFAVCLAVGTNPDGFLALLVAAGLGFVGLFYAAVVTPRFPLALLFAEVVAFPVLPVVQGRGVNPIDVIMPVVLLVTWLFRRDGRATWAGGEDVERGRNSILRAVGAYYALALLSLVLLGLRGDPADALESLYALTRSVQGAFFFYLVGRYATDPDGIRFTRNAVLGGLAITFLVDLNAALFGGVPRAGAVIIFGQPKEYSAASWAIGSAPFVMTNPNELAAACLLVWALVFAVRPGRLLLAVSLLGSFVLLLMTQSRGGLVAWLVFVVAYGTGRGRRWMLVLPLIAIALVPLLPQGLRERIVRTVVLQRGSFEAYSSLIRVYCWQTSFKVFLAHPLVGVGYVGFQYVSHLYNTLGVRLFNAESYFMEMLSGVGVGALFVLGWIARSILRMASLARKLGAPGSLAHGLGTVAPAFLLAVGSANLTGDLLVGLLGVSQLALFVALLVQATRLPACWVAPTAAGR